jgi:hypothetical protein
VAAGQEQDEDATVKLANGITRGLLHRPLPEDKKLDRRGMRRSGSTSLTARAPPRYGRPTRLLTRPGSEMLDVDTALTPISRR